MQITYMKHIRFLFTLHNKLDHGSLMCRLNTVNVPSLR